MSMISEQVADLREKAQIFENSGCATDGIVKTFRKAADTIEELSAKLAINSQPPADQWIPCSERLPNRDEYLKDDGRFIVTDGNRSYQCIFDMYTGKFKRFAWNKLLEEDKFVIAWQPLPEPYKGVE